MAKPKAKYKAKRINGAWYVSGPGTLAVAASKADAERTANKLNGN